MERIKFWLCTLMSTVILILVASCVSIIPAPSDGVVSLTYRDVQATIVLPVIARGLKNPSTRPDMIYFVNGISDDHTVVAGLIIIGIPDSQSGKSSKDIFKKFSEEYEQSARRNPGRKGAVLRSLERTGKSRQKQLEEGIFCVEYLIVYEDRLVPGHKGEPYIGHNRDYICVYTEKNVIVRVIYSERFPVERNGLDPTFEDNLDFLFESLRVH